MEKLKNILDDKDLSKQYPDEVKSDKWINVAVMKDGTSQRSRKIHTTEQAARESADRTEIKIFMNPYCRWHTLDGKFISKDYSYHIQMPVQ
jgi:hypothetical protein